MNIVSGFISNINLRADRDITKYIDFGIQLMSVEIPMTIFIERTIFDADILPKIQLPISASGEFIYRIQGGIMDGMQQKYSYIRIGHITFVFFSVQDLFLLSYRATAHKFALNTGNPQKDTLEYMMVQCQKSEWMAIAEQLSSQTDSEQTKEYVWVDFGIFHMFHGKIDVFQIELYTMRARIHQRLFRNKESSRLTFARCWDPANHIYHGNIYKDVNWLFAGSVFGGGATMIRQFALRVREKCLQVMRSKNTLMWEINIWALIYRESEFLFSLYPSDHSEIIFRGYV